VVSTFSVNNQISGTISVLLEAFDSNSYLIESGTFTATIDGTTPFTAKTFDVTSSGAVPNNPLVDAKYFFIFTPVFRIPANSYITITFGTNYGLLYN